MSLGLAPIVAEWVFSSLEEAARSGITIVLIEQFVHHALALADSCVILTRGRVGWSGPAADAGQEVLVITVLCTVSSVVATQVSAAGSPLTLAYITSLTGAGAV